MAITRHIITCTFLINLDVSLSSSTLTHSLFHVDFSINDRDCFGSRCFRLHFLFQHIRPLFLRIAISTGKILTFLLLRFFTVYNHQIKDLQVWSYNHIMNNNLTTRSLAAFLDLFIYLYIHILSISVFHFVLSNIFSGFYNFDYELKQNLIAKTVGFLGISWSARLDLISYIYVPSCLHTIFRCWIFYISFFFCCYVFSSYT